MINVNKEISIQDLINDKSIKDQLKIKADNSSMDYEQTNLNGGDTVTSPENQEVIFTSFCHPPQT